MARGPHEGEVKLRVEGRPGHGAAQGLVFDGADLTCDGLVEESMLERIRASKPSGRTARKTR